MTSFSYQFTLDEYRKEIEDYKKGDLKMPSKTDFTDVLYTKKYAHTLIPWKLIALDILIPTDFQQKKI